MNLIETADTIVKGVKSGDLNAFDVRHLIEEIVEEVEHVEKLERVNEAVYKHVEEDDFA